jgi:uncharacterized protein
MPKRKAVVYLPIDWAGQHGLQVGIHSSEKNPAFCSSIAPSSHAVKYLRAAAEAACSFMIYTIFKDQAGEYRWRLCAKNYIVIAISGEGYKNHKDCSDSIDLVKESSSAPVIDTTNKGRASGRGLPLRIWG